VEGGFCSGNELLQNVYCKRSCGACWIQLDCTTLNPTISFNSIQFSSMKLYKGN
jgi:hypothetical protein